MRMARELAAASGGRSNAAARTRVVVLVELAVAIGITSLQSRSTWRVSVQPLHDRVLSSRQAALDGVIHPR
jgi:hypothetical protein